MQELDKRAKAILETLTGAIKCLDTLIIGQNDSPVYENPPTCLSYSSFICKYLDEDGKTEKIAILPIKVENHHDIWSGYLNDHERFPNPLYAAVYFISTTYPLYGIIGLGVEFDSGLKDNNMSSIILGTPKDFV